MPLFYQGKQLVAPQVVSSVDDAALASANVRASAIVGVVGPSTGGVPNTALTFTTAAAAALTLRSGALLDSIRRVFDPGANTPGAGSVIAVRATNAGTPALQSSLILKDASVVNSVNLTSVDYGIWNNQIRAKVEAGTTQGSKITISAPVAGIVQNAVMDNVYRACIAVQYTGSSSTSSLTISATQFATTNNAGTDNVTLLFTNNPDLQSIVDALNATGKYVASVLAGPTDAATTLDGTTYSDIKTTSINTTGNLQAFVDTVNKSGQTFVTAARNGSSLIAPTTVAYTYLASGTDGAALANADWTTALAVLEPQPVGIVCAATNSATIHAAVLTHVSAMSDINGRRERIAVLGGATGETIAQAITRATNLGSARVGLVYPGLSEADPVTGVLTAYDPVITAAKVAGVLSGDSLQNAATFKFIGATSMEKALKDSEVDQLLTAGVLPVQNIPNRGKRIVQSVSTYTADNKYSNVELSVRRTVDAVAQTVRAAVEPLLGQTTGPALYGIALGAVDSALSALFRAGLLVGTPVTNPPFKNVQVSIAGNVIAVTFQAQIGVPANYITVAAHIQAFGA